MSINIEKQVAAHLEFGKQICLSLAQQIQALGLPADAQIGEPVFTSAEFSLVTDPYTQQTELVAHWYKPGRQKIGQIQFHADGSFYAEYDVIQVHPQRPAIFIESILAWGKLNQIKTEPKYLPIPDQDSL